VPTASAADKAVRPGGRTPTASLDGRLHARLKTAARESHAEGPPGRRLVAVALLVSAAMAAFPIWPTWDQLGTSASIDQIQQNSG